MADQGQLKGTGRKGPSARARRPGGRKRRVVIDSGAAGRARTRARRASAPSRGRSSSRGRTADRPGHGPLGRHRQGPVRRRSASPVAADHQDHDGPREMVTITQSLSDEAVELIATELKREVTIKHAAEEELEPEVYEDARRGSRRRARPWSRSWATSTTARRRCSTRSARRRSSRPRPAGSRSTSARTRSSTTAARSRSSTRRATRRSPPCAPAARR